MVLGIWGFRFSLDISFLSLGFDLLGRCGSLTYLRCPEMFRLDSSWLSCFVGGRFFANWFFFLLFYCLLWINTDPKMNGLTFFLKQLCFDQADPNFEYFVLYLIIFLSDRKCFKHTIFFFSHVLTSKRSKWGRDLNL